MTSPWLKVVRDVRGERARSALIVMAIAIGVAGLFAVLSSYAILRRELNAGYLATSPASAVLTTDAISEELLTSLSARSDLAAVDARRVLRGRIRTGGSQWKRLVLFVIRDLDQQRISIVTREHGSQPVAPGDLLIERDAFQVAKARVGDVVDVELTPGSRHRLRVAGGVHDVGQAQARMENTVYGYITPATLPLLDETAALDRLYLLVSGRRFDEAHVRRVADDVRASLETQGHRVTRVTVPTPGQHPHAAIMGVLLLSMAAFGIVVLTLSGIIVSTLVTATMAAQRRQIGVMHAVGGSRRQIAQIYLSQALLYGVAAVTLGVPTGFAGGSALTGYLAALLNFDVTSTAIPVWVYLLTGIIGGAVPVAAAAYPVAAATADPVRRSLDDVGMAGGMPAAGRLARAGARLGGLGGPWLLGVRNSFRRRTRTTLTLATLAAAGASFMSALNVRSSMMALLDAMFGDGTFGAADRYAFDQHMLMIYVFLLIVAGILASVGSLGMITATSLNVLDRRREFGVLRAIGAAPSTVAGIVVIESAFMALVSWLLAIALAWPISAVLGRFLSAALFRRSMTVTFSLPGVVAWLVVTALIAVTSSLVPALVASRRSIREAVSYE